MANKIFKGVKFPGMDDYYVLPEAVITKNEDGIIEIESYMPGESNIVIDKTLSTSGAVAEAKAVGDALQNKVSVVAGSRLMTQEEANKLAKLVIDEDGNVGSTDIINVGNAEGILAITHGGTGNTTGYIQTGAQNGSSIGNKATIEGANNIGSGESSHVEGASNTASGDYSHAEGVNSEAGGDYSHAEGVNTYTSGIASHAEGANSEATGGYSHAEGNFSQAKGEYSHAEGQNTIASGESSHAEGRDTLASSSYQHVQGRYNIEDTDNTYAHIVGNGSSTTRSNAHTLDWDGNAWFAGNLSVDGYTKTGNCYNLPPVYRHNTGVLINLGSIQSETMITLNITGNAYTGGNNINSVIQFYHFQTSEGFYGYSGTHYGANFGNVTVYKYDGKMYAWFTGTTLSDYCTFNVQVISNKSLGDINISDSAPHTADEGATYITDIVPVVAQLTDTTYTLGSFGITASADELNYIDGVTSNIQTQLNSKASTAVATVVSNGLMSADDKTRLICHTHTRFGGYDSGGYLKIKINAGYSWMLSFILRVYSSYRATDIQISGYSYGSNHWYNQRAITIADSHPDSNVEVNFGYDDDGLLWIATPAGDYSAAGIFNVVNGFDQIPADQWENLFTITRVDELTGTVQSTSNSTMLASSSSAGLMSAADKTKLDGLSNSSGMVRKYYDDCNTTSISLPADDYKLFVLTIRVANYDEDMGIDQCAVIDSNRLTTSDQVVYQFFNLNGREAFFEGEWLHAWQREGEGPTFELEESNSVITHISAYY